MSLYDMGPCDDFQELLMDIAYFKLTDMAERVKYLLSLRELSPHDFEKNQIRSAASTIAQCSRRRFPPSPL